MKKFKRIIAITLSVLLLITSIPSTALTAFAAAADDSNIVLGSNGKITRAEWLHNLVYVFEMVVEEEALPDNYYSDLDESHKYYEDILLAVEFGVVDVEAGGTLRPDDAVTREFAASTLNFCLGYQLDEGAEYTFADYGDCLDPDSAQVAVDRNWFALISGNFSPGTLVTESEVEFMLDDALEILGKTVVDATYTSTFEFEDDIIVIPDGTEVTEDGNGTVHITNCSQTINSGDRFAVYYNGIPSVYTADTVSIENSVTTITTTKVESDDAFVSVDAQGVADAEAMEITPVEGVDVSFEEDNSGISTFSTKKLKSIKAKTELELFPGVTADVSVKIKSPEIEYSVSSSYAYVLLQGDTEISYSIEANLVEMAFGNKAIELFNVSVLGIGNFTVSVEFELSGAASGEVEGYLVAGIECTKGGKLRAIKSFQQKQYSSNVEATASVGLKVTLGITKMPVISAYIYAEAGVKANLKSTTYKDDKEPHKCVHFAAYLYVKYGASASAKFGGWKTSLSVNYDIFNDKNSPVKIVHHYENGVLVPSCTRGTDYSNFFTKASSRWGGSGWISANGAYGLNADGTYFALYDYTLNENNEATITEYNGNSWSVYIPKEIDGYTVVSVGSGSFQGKDVKKVVIPNSVTTIDTLAFKNCYYLTNITLPNSITTLNTGTFLNCQSLCDISIPDSVTSINSWVFYNCDSLNEVALPNNLTSLGGGAFYDCNGLKKVYIPKSLSSVSTSTYTTLGIYTYKGAFHNCNNLVDIEFEAGRTEIPSNMFFGCDGLITIDIPNTVTSIGSSAFWNCTNMTDVIFPDTITNISSWAFYNCDSLEKAIFPNSLLTLGGGAFYDCDCLRKVYIPKSLNTVSTATNINQSIYSYKGAFHDCSNLTDVDFEKGRTEILDNMFYGCDGLKSIVIPETVTKIGEEAFMNCIALESITIPEKVVTIQEYAFSNCNSMSRVELHNGVSAIGAYAFNMCSALESIDIPESVVSIGKNSFENCTSLKNATLPDGWTELPTRMFANCSSLQTITLPSSLTTINIGAFYECGSLCVSFENLKDLKIIDAQAFYGCSSITEVILSNKVSTIEQSAFEGCSSLNKVFLPQSTKTLGYSAFMDCERLSEVTLADYGITAINSSTFKNCPSLASIVLPKGLTSIGSQAFMNDIALVNVTIPESVTSIDSTAFSYPAKTTVYGKSGSYAETFANDGGFTFKDNSIPVEGILLKGSGDNIIIDRYETYRAEFEVYPEDANDVITLTANNSNVTINGHDIYARYAGDTVITATSTSGLTYQFNVHIRSIKGIEVITNPTKTTYIMGEEFDKTGMVVKVNYYDGSSKIVDDYTISGFDSSVEGTNTVTVKWMSSTSQILTTYSTTFTVNIVDPTPKLTGIFIETLPNKLNFELREKLDTTGLVVKGTYTDNSSKEITDYTVSGYNALKSGSQTITVTYGDYTATFTVSVGAVKTLSAVSVAQAPAKTEYYIGDALSTAGLQLTLTYSDNSTTTVSSGFTTSGFDSASAGTKTITVSYEGISTTFTVKVKTPSIVISEAEKSLLVDEIVTLTAATDPTGQTITWISSNNSVATVSNGVVTAKSEGSAVITARFIYNGINYEKNCTISVTEPEATLTTIDIVSEPSKTIYYIGDNLVTSGLQVKLTYSDSTTDTITTGYSVTGFTSATAGTKTVTVSYGGLTDTFTVTVKTPSITLSSNAETITVGEDVTLSATTLPSGQSVVWTSSSDSIATVNNGTVVAEGAGTAVITAKFTYNGVVYSATCSITVESIPVTLTSISVNTQPSKTVYEIGESLDTTGLVLKLTYSDDSTDTVTSGFTTSGFSSATAGTKTVTVQYGGLTTSFIVTVNAALAPEDAPQLIMGSSETMAGKEVVVTLSVKNNPGIAGLAVSLKYDESVLTLKDTENGGLFSGFTAAKNFAWDESEDVTDDGVLATFVFMVAEDAPAGDYNIEVLVRSCTNENLDDVALLTTNGTISVIDFVYGDSNGDQKIDMKDVVLLRKYITNFDYDTNTSSVNVELGADANGDNKIDMKDVVILRKYITNYDYDTESSTVVLGPQ